MRMAFENPLPTRGLGWSAGGRIAPARGGGRAQAGPLARPDEMTRDSATAPICADLRQNREGFQ